MAFAEKLPEETRRMTVRYLRGISAQRATATSTQPPAERLAELLRAQGNSDARAYQVSALFRDWASKDLRAATQAAGSLPDTARGQGSPRFSAVAQILAAWQKTDPAAAGQWLDGIELTSKYTLQELFGTQIAGSNPAAAYAYAARQPAGGEERDGRDGRFRTIDAVFQEAFKTDPEGAIAFFDALPERTSEFHSEVWSQRLLADPARATEELLNHPVWKKEDFKWPWTGIINNALVPLAKKDPQAAAEFAVKVPRGDKVEIFAEIAKPWAARDGTAAVTWAAALPAGPAREAALGEFAAAWAEHDTAQVQATLARLPDAAARAAATEGFARAVFDTDPEAALRTLRALPREADRLERLARAWSRWENENAAGAHDWATHATLTPAERAALEQ